MEGCEGMRRYAILLLTCLFTGGALADQLVLSGQTKEGSFQGFEKNKFLFMTSKGRMARENTMRVTKLIIASPVKVTYQTNDSKKDEDGQLKGYEKNKFLLVGKDGKDISINVMKMKKIDVSFDEEGGDIKDGSKYPIPAIDVAALEAGELNENQKAVLERFKDAKAKYDEFFNKSSQLVAQMDKAQGGKREELLNELRARKNDEQPLKRAAVAAFKALAEAFPEQDDQGKAPPPKAQPVQKTQPAPKAQPPPEAEPAAKVEPVPKAEPPAKVQPPAEGNGAADNTGAVKKNGRPDKIKIEW